MTLVLVECPHHLDQETGRSMWRMETMSEAPCVNDEVVFEDIILAVRGRRFTNTEKSGWVVALLTEVVDVPEEAVEVPDE